VFRAISGFSVLKAKLRGRKVLCGAVTLSQRFGGALNIGPEFLPVLPRNSGFTVSADHAKMALRPRHSHSIVSEAFKSLKF
jgi:hypothetical protein